MNQGLTVKKNKAERHGIRALFMFIISTSALCVVLLQQPLFVLVFMPGILIIAVVLFYYETWQISFYANTIITRAFFVKSGSYTYTQIMDVMKSNSFTDHAYVELVFSNGRRIRFRFEDENATKAMHKIRSNHSIRIVN